MLPVSAAAPLLLLLLLLLVVLLLLGIVRGSGSAAFADVSSSRYRMQCSMCGSLTALAHAAAEADSELRPPERQPLRRLRKAGDEAIREAQGSLDYA
jgi:hypothetical protein